MIQYLGIHQRKANPIITPQQPTFGPELIKLLKESEQNWNMAEVNKWIGESNKGTKRERKKRGQKTKHIQLSTAHNRSVLFPVLFNRAIDKILRSVKTQDSEIPKIMVCNDDIVMWKLNESTREKKLKSIVTVWIFGIKYVVMKILLKRRGTENVKHTNHETKKWKC